MGISPRKLIAERSKIVALIVFIVFLIIPISVGWVYYNTASALKQQSADHLKAEVNLAASALQLKLNHLTELAAAYAALPQLSQNVRVGNWSGAAAAARDAQNNVAFYDPYIDRVVFFDNNGIEQSAYPTLAGGIGTDAINSAWYKMLQQTDAVVVPPVTQRAATPSLNVVNIAAPIHDNDTNAVVGYLVLQIPTEHFLDFGYALSTGTYGFTYIIDQNGNLVAHPQYAENGVISFAQIQPVPELLAGQNGAMITEDAAGNQKNFISYQSISQYGWGIVAQEPYTEAFASYESTLLLTEEIIIMFLLIDLFISYLVFRFLTSRSSRRHEPTSAKSTAAGFTLIELLVVIAIIAILSIVVVLALNPAEMLRQSRDSQRISDLGTLKSAISLYLLDSANANIASSIYGYGSCYLSTIAGNGTTSPKCGVFTNAYTANVSTTQTLYRKNDSTGWLPVNFSQITLGTPLSSLPIDPVNNASYYYAYAATSSNGTFYFEINAFMESKKYGPGGSNDVVTTDGGDNTSTYEAGSKPGLNL
jgi:prepilin-type N-terminal cleavage/methylation domain-containing protein